MHWNDGRGKRKLVGAIFHAWDPTAVALAKMKFINEFQRIKKQTKSVASLALVLKVYNSGTR